MAKLPAHFSFIYLEMAEIATGTETRNAERSSSAVPHRGDTY